MSTIHVYEYHGAEPLMTRGEYGVNVTGAHTRLDDPSGLYVFDPDFGDRFLCPVDRAEECGFVLVGEEEAHEDSPRFR